MGNRSLIFGYIGFDRVEMTLGHYCGKGLGVRVVNCTGIGEGGLVPGEEFYEGVCERGAFDYDYREVHADCDF